MLRKTMIVAVAALLAFGLIMPAQASAYSGNIAAAQKIMTKFGIPAGPVDGLDGAQTRRGLCIFRYMSDMPTNRNKLNTATLNKLKSFNKKYSSLGKIPAVSGSSYKEKLTANETCQAMTFSVANSKGKHYYKRVMAISTGISQYNTPNGGYLLGGTQKGWHCSTLYPETCAVYKNGRFAKVKNHPNKPAGYGNMYNFRSFKSGGWGLHGSNSVPTYPASHGCIRVSVANSDWMYDHVGNYSKPYLAVTGAY